jgi:cytochrome P450
VAFLQDTARTYGPICSFRVLNQQICLVDDAEIVKQILVTDQHKFVRDSGATLLRELVGNGLLTSDEPRHRERRRVMQPAFHREQVASYAKAMANETERLALAWRSADRVNIGAEMKRLTLSIVGSALFGIDFGASTARIAEILQRAIRRSAYISLALPLLEPLLVAYRRGRPKQPSLFFRRERSELQRIIAPILTTRRERAAGDVLSLLLEYGKLPEEDISDEVVTLVLAGHETTATALTWTWYLLSKHPDIERKLQEEADAVLGNREATFEDVSRLPYTAMIFSEALRLYPPALAFGRRPIEPVELGGFRIAPKTSIILSPYITQRNPRYFNRPEDFNPDRWSSQDWPKFAYFPFGGGAKMCIGDSFAKLEGVLVLATLAKHWSLRREDESCVGVQPGITLGPDRVIWMTPIPRRQ